MAASELQSQFMKSFFILNVTLWMLGMWDLNTCNRYNSNIKIDINYLGQIFNLNFVKS